MELQYPLTITVVLVILTSILFFMLFRTRTSKAQKLPPGPRKLPIIGNFHNLIGCTLPHHTLRDLAKEYGPLMHLQLGEVSTLIVSSADVAREFMRTNDAAFAQRPDLFAVQFSDYGTSHLSLAPYGEYLRQMKKVCVMELLSSKRIQFFASLRKEETDRLVEAVRSSLSSSSINLTEKLLKMTSTFTCRAALGGRYDTQDATSLVSAIKEGSFLLGGFNVADFYPSKKIFRVISPLSPRLLKVSKKMDYALENIIKEHMSDREMKPSAGEASEDLVDILLRVQKTGGLEIPIKTNDIKAIICDMFAGGTETTATTAEWAMAELVKSPRVMRKAQAEIRQALKGKMSVEEKDIQDLTYLKLVIKETLRLHPPLPLLLPRECREQCTANGYDIPLKTRVIINAWAIARDPIYWGPDAESFLPERFIEGSVDFKGAHFELIPFGAGRRICPGILFGLTNVELALSQLLYHFDWSLPGATSPEAIDMTELFGASVGRKNNLCLVAVPFTA